MGGAAALAGAGGEATGAAAGAGGASCANPEQQVVAITADTWIEAAQRGTGHGTDPALSVAGGVAERRALLQLTLPAAAAGKVLSRASLVLHLQADADVTLAPRQLGLHQLQRPVSELHTSWSNYDNGGNHRWDLPGGDFGAEISATTLPAGTKSGALAFEVTAPILNIIGAAAIPLSVIVVEKGPAPAAPAELAFTSREGDALLVPRLLLDYCDP